MLSLLTLIVVLAVVRSHPTINSRHRIVGGSDATIEEFPHQVAIETEFETFVCGGSIISEKVILSAAHPFSEKNEITKENYFARVGSALRENEGQLYSFSWEKIVIHPKYNYKSYDFDVAILKLDEPILFSLQASPVNLVPMDAEPSEGETLIVTGFGQISFNETKVPEKLQVATLPKRNRDACSSLDDRKITERMICAGIGSPSPFQGDSGGPLINEKRQLVGIVSWGRRQPTGNDPTVFVNVAEAGIHKFIAQNMNF